MTTVLLGLETQHGDPLPAARLGQRVHRLARLRTGQQLRVSLPGLCPRPSLGGETRSIDTLM